MGKKRKNTTWPQTGKMTDVEVKCHDMEANMAVRIVYKEDLKRSQFNWVVNRRKRKRYFSQRMLAAEPLPDTLKPFMWQLAKAKNKRWK